MHERQRWWVKRWSWHLAFSCCHWWSQLFTPTAMKVRCAAFLRCDCTHVNENRFSQKCCVMWISLFRFGDCFRWWWPTYGQGSVSMVTYTTMTKPRSENEGQVSRINLDLYTAKLTATFYVLNSALQLFLYLHRPPPSIRRAQGRDLAHLSKDHSLLMRVQRGRINKCGALFGK